MSAPFPLYPTSSLFLFFLMSAPFPLYPTSSLFLFFLMSAPFPLYPTSSLFLFFLMSAHFLLYPTSSLFLFFLMSAPFPLYPTSSLFLFFLMSAPFPLYPTSSLLCTPLYSLLSFLLSTPLPLYSLLLCTVYSSIPSVYSSSRLLSSPLCYLLLCHYCLVFVLFGDSLLLSTVCSCSGHTYLPLLNCLQFCIVNSSSWSTILPLHSSVVYSSSSLLSTIFDCQLLFAVFSSTSVLLLPTVFSASLLWTLLSLVCCASFVDRNSARADMMGTLTGPKPAKVNREATLASKQPPTFSDQGQRYVIIGAWVIERDATS